MRQAKVLTGHDGRGQLAVHSDREREQFIRSVSALLPDNYSAVLIDGAVVVRGEDRMGWTLDDYVIPRLASGLIFAEEMESDR